MSEHCSINRLVVFDLNSVTYPSNQVLCYKALSQWNSGRFSDGLSNAAVALEFLVRNLREDEEVRCGLGRTAVTCLSSMLREASTGQAVAAETERRAGEEASGANAELVRAVREAAGTKSGKTVDMVPALQFVELVCERLAKVTAMAWFLKDFFL